MTTHEQDPSMYPDSPEGLVGRYNSGFDELLKVHDQQLGHIAPDHIARVQDAAFEVPFLDIPVKEVADATLHTFYNVNRYFDGAREIFAEIIFKNPDVASRWRAVNNAIRMYGIDNFRTQDQLIAIEDKRMLAVVRAELDKTVWEATRKRAEMYGVDNFRVDDMISYASSKKAGAAMRAALDKTVWETTVKRAKMYGVDNFRVDDIVEHTSDKKVTKVFKNLINNNFERKSGNAQNGSNSYTFRDSDPFFGGAHRARHSNGNGSQSRTKNQQSPPFTKQQTTPKPETPPRDRRIDVVKGKDVSAPDQPIVRLLKNLDHHRAEGKTDQQIYRLLIRHFHPDTKHPESDTMSRVITGAYDSKTKTFLV